MIGLQSGLSGRLPVAKQCAAESKLDHGLGLSGIEPKRSPARELARCSFGRQTNALAVIRSRMATSCARNTATDAAKAAPGQ